MLSFRNILFIIIVVLSAGFLACGKGSGTGLTIDTDPDSPEYQAADIPVVLSENCDLLKTAFLNIRHPNIKSENWQTRQGYLSDGLITTNCYGGGKTETRVSYDEELDHRSEWNKVHLSCVNDVGEMSEGTIYRNCFGGKCEIEKYVYDFSKAEPCSSVSGTVARVGVSIEVNDEGGISSAQLRCDGGVTGICNGVTESCAAFLDSYNICDVR